ncbi:MAG: TOBE domain-containing protein [Halodesulfurarchaeum sp.]
MDPSFEAQLRAGEVVFSERDAELLEAIEETGSLNQAAASLGRSYARCQKRVDALETAFGSLVERTRGGAGGGGSSVTSDGRELLARFERLQAGYAAVASVEETGIDGTVVGRDGELADIDTAAGTMRALAPPGVDRVVVGVRADAVTLQAPTETPPAEATSARNRFEGTVTAVTEGEAVGHVEVDIGAEELLSVLVTATSRKRLGLEPGREVVASFKATAARCTDRERFDEDVTREQVV